MAGNVLAADVIKQSEVNTLLGKQAKIKADKSGVRIDQAKITQTDLICSNGVIHVIDQVLFPPKETKNQELDSIAQTAIKSGSFKTLVKALKAAGLVETLNGEGNLTVFAPNDEAFAKLPKDVLESVLADKEKLKAILTYHVLSTKELAASVIKTEQYKTLQGQSVNVSVGKDEVKINNAKILKTDILCSNGVIHVIDSVLLPQSETQSDNYIFQAGNDDARLQWVTVNDGVMGGVSQGNVKLTEDKIIEFSGKLSLKNNGGFASVRSRSTNLGLKEGDVLVARVRGDGRQYYMNLQVPTFRIAFSYRAPVQTKADEWIEVKVPVSDFVATSFGRKVRGSLNPKSVNSIGFLLADKKAGPFKLEIDSIRIEQAIETNTQASR